jgi:hypothetical protein
MKGAAGAKAVPVHVSAPYFEAYSSDNPATLAKASGNKYLTFAFIQTPSHGSCTIDWNGSSSTPVNGSTYGSAIASIRASGGDIIPSFGGYSADHNGTEIADSCTDVNKIAAAYEQVVTAYNVTRLDLDTEDNSLTNSAGIDRRNKAIHLVETWAKSHNRTVQFSYTLPTNVSGLDPTGVNVLSNAVKNGARIDVFNLMTFDYYDGQKHEMSKDTVTAVTNVVSQLEKIYPSAGGTKLLSQMGVTEMPGIDDYGAAETFTQADAGTVEKWAKSSGIAELSFWALERDNGGCPGTGGSDTCSGISQPTWYFSHAFEPFTS